MNVKIQVEKFQQDQYGLAAISVRIPELENSFDLDLPFERLYERCGIPDDVTLDFLITASLCYVIDKIVPRRSAIDSWTREIKVTFPVTAPKLWRGVAHNLEAALGFLTGDIWQISFRRSDGAFFRLDPGSANSRRREHVPKITGATGVCLFSGGLDSLIGAIDLLAAEGEEKVLLIGHYDTPGPASQQNTLFAGIEKTYPGRVDLLQTRVSHRPRAAREATLRSRSLVFMAIGIYAARSFGKIVPLYAPENGLIAINVPLTPSRSGSCSTRTMHPFFLGQLASVLKGLGFENEIINPVRLKTKGECVAECLNGPLLRTLAGSSVSCSHATRRQHWIRKQASNCGYCVPCIIRRASLHKAGLDDRRNYGVDVCKGELSLEGAGESADDLRAVLDFLYNRKTQVEIARAIAAIAPITEMEDHAATVERGFEEIRTLVGDKASPVIRRAAGIVSKK